MQELSCWSSIAKAAGGVCCTDGKLPKSSAVGEVKQVHVLCLSVNVCDHWPDIPPMKVRGLGASPENLAPEKSKPGCCRHTWGGWRDTEPFQLSAGN